MQKEQISMGAMFGCGGWLVYWLVGCLAGQGGKILWKQRSLAPIILQLWQNISLSGRTSLWAGRSPSRNSSASIGRILFSCHSLTSTPGGGRILQVLPVQEGSCLPVTHWLADQEKEECLKIKYKIPPYKLFNLNKPTGIFWRISLSSFFSDAQNMFIGCKILTKTSHYSFIKEHYIFLQKPKTPTKSLQMSLKKVGLLWHLTSWYILVFLKLMFGNKFILKEPPLFLKLNMFFCPKILGWTNKKTCKYPHYLLYFFWHVGHVQGIQKGLSNMLPN